MGDGERVKGKVCLVTGAAMGLGEAIARRLAAEGARVVVADIDTRGEAVAEQIGEAFFVRLDVTDEAQWEAAMEATRARFGRLDVLVNNAGISEPGTIEDSSLALWRRHQAVNGDGVFLGCKHAVAAMKEGGSDRGGSIINMSSSLGIRANGGFAAYCASKGAVRLLTKSVALHCGRSGTRIRCNSIHPGAIRTPMYERIVGGAPDPAALERAFVEQHPIGHVGEPVDVANAALFLASDESRFVTGCELTVDGGLTIA